MEAATPPVTLKGKVIPFIPLFLILILAGLLRFYHLSGQSLWSDEGNSVALAQRGFAEIAQRTAFDIHPPFYYWLLRLWISLFGDSEIGLRSLSVVLGIGLVALIGLLGTYLFELRLGTIAALIAALSPFQIYYSQEARMYMLLALLGGLTLFLTLLFLEEARWGRRLAFALGYILVACAGLYTHYAYPLVLILANLLALAWFIGRGRRAGMKADRPLLLWLGMQLILLCLYLPWLPVAWRQVTTWPSDQQTASLGEMIATVSATLLAGLAWPYGDRAFMAAGLVLLLGLTVFIPSPRRVSMPVVPFLWLWLLLPILLTLFIYSPAFLKFLLIASPALALLLALAAVNLVAILKHNWGGYLAAGSWLMLVCGLSLLALFHYYTDTRYARDNYRGIVQFIKAVGADRDAVVLNAEGQQDIFGYYAQRYGLNLPVYPLPRQRPLDKAVTLAELKSITNTADNIYGVYWGTHQADPEGVVEGWLDSHLFKATDHWYGNVRLVSYGVPQRQFEAFSLTPLKEQLGEKIQFTGYGVAEAGVEPGDILQVALQWQTGEPLAQDYIVFLQLLDPVNHVVGQRDAPPTLPSSAWPAGEAVLDIHGIFIEPGTPPGKHRLIVGLYHPETGQRLPVSGMGEGTGDFVELGEVEILPAAAPLPAAAFEIQTPKQVPLAGLTWLGYDFYKLGHRSTPDTPLHTGDPVQLVAYWRLDRPEPQTEDTLLIELVTNQAETTGISLTQPLAGVDYPLDQWRVGEIVRAQYVFFLSGLEPGVYQVALTWQGQRVMTGPFRVEP